MGGQGSFGPHVVGGRGEWRELGRLARSDLEGTWARLLAITARTDDPGLYWVADIIEDLITHHGWEFASRLERELETNGRLRLAYADVKPRHSDPQLEDRLLALREAIDAEQ